MTPRFIVCRASAGSGKTYTLVRQFLEIAISSPTQLEERFEHILAITFTNKAANGMKERIMDQLDRIVRRDPRCDNLVAEMSKDLSVEETEVRRRCEVLQSAILHHYSKLSVCTIDSFVHRIVRTFAHDLHLPLGFEVMTDPKEVLETSVDQLLSLAGSEEERSLTRILCAFAESKMETGAAYTIEKQITKLAEEILKEETPAYLEKLESLDFQQFLDIYGHLRSDIRQIELQFQEVAQRFVQACEAQGLRCEDFPGKSNGALAYMQRVAEGRLDLVAKPYAKACNAYDAEAFSDKEQPRLQPVLSLFRDTFGQLMQLSRDYTTKKMLTANLFSIALLGKVSQLKEEYYNENETVHISEFNKRIAKEVADQPTPFIYERIGSRYHNYLIDEFQDTSKMQWSNFLPLLDEAMAHRCDPQLPPVGTQSLVVGDGKQAIYRFRQGDVRQFMHLPQVDKESIHGQSLQHYARIDTLQDNWRTCTNIVQFNNRFFTQLMGHNGPFEHNPVLSKLYIGYGESEVPELWQHPRKEGGYVNVGFYEEEQMLPAILAAIRHQIDELGYDYGDILILARKNATLAQIAAYLTENSQEHPIPLVSSESFILSGSRVVLLLQALLKYLYNPQDRVAAAQSVQLLSQIGVIPRQVHHLLVQLRQFQWNLSLFLREYNIVFEVDWLRSLSLYDLCEQLVRVFRLNGKDSAYVASLLGVVATFAQHPHAHLGALVKYLDENIDKRSSATAGTHHAVRLMTIHKAKGLEEKIVILALPYQDQHGSQHWVEVPQEVGDGLPVAFVNSQKGKTSHFDAVFQEEEQLSQMDRINLLYVALTRPEEKLLVFCQDKSSKEGLDDIALLRSFVSTDGQCRSVDENCFEVGTDSEKQAVAADLQQDSNSMPVREVSFPQWQDRVSIADQHAALLSPLEDDSRRFGILVHDLMAHILTPDDIDPVLANYCRQHHLDDGQIQSIVQRIHSAVAQYPQLFQKGLRVLCEQPLAVDGQVLRPDRIVFAPDAVYVVDYKTGAQTPEAQQRYQQQVDTYAAALRRMGYSPVYTAIIYL